MKSERQLQEILKSLCGSPGAEDGSDPREFHKQRGRDKSLRKTYQLCKQVDEVLGYVLSGECDDDVLRDFYVSTGTRCVAIAGNTLPLFYGHGFPTGPGARAAWSCGG